MWKKYSFDITMILIASLSLIVAIYSFIHGSGVISLVTAFIFVFALFSLLGRLVAPYYLDAYAVNILRSSGGRMRGQQLSNFNGDNNGLDSTVSRIVEKGYAFFQEDMVVLKDKYSTGKLSGFISNWALKGIEKRAKKRTGK